VSERKPVLVCPECDHDGFECTSCGASFNSPLRPVPSPAPSERPDPCEHLRGLKTVLGRALVLRLRSACLASALAEYRAECEGTGETPRGWDGMWPCATCKGKGVVPLKHDADTKGDDDGR